MFPVATVRPSRINPSSPVNDRGPSLSRSRKDAGNQTAQDAPAPLGSAIAPERGSSAKIDPSPAVISSLPRCWAEARCEILYCDWLDARRELAALQKRQERLEDATFAERGELWRAIGKATTQRNALHDMIVLLILDAQEDFIDLPRQHVQLILSPNDDSFLVLDRGRPRLRIAPQTIPDPSVRMKSIDLETLLQYGEMINSIYADLPYNRRTGTAISAEFERRTGLRVDVKIVRLACERMALTLLRPGCRLDHELIYRMDAQLRVDDPKISTWNRSYRIAELYKAETGVTVSASGVFSILKSSQPHAVAQ